MTVRIPSNSKIRTNTKTKIRMKSAGENFYVITAIGGNRVDDITVGGLKYRVHTFTSSGILTVTSAPNNIAQVEYLCVAGGGGGGNGVAISPPGTAGGGGGAGGLLTGTLQLPVGSYTVTVGTGGGGGSSPTLRVGSDGNPSKIVWPNNLITVESFGGGGGGSTSSGRPGGSGGGADGYGDSFGFYSSTGGTGVTGQGFPGGSHTTSRNVTSDGGAGGGGAGGAGTSTLTPPATVTPGDGGLGKETSIRGYPEFFAGGGGGGSPIGGAPGSGVGGSGTSTFGTNGIASTGSGGGGANSGNSTGGNGSGGIVIFRYPIV